MKITTEIKALVFKAKAVISLVLVRENNVWSSKRAEKADTEVLDL